MRAVLLGAAAVAAVLWCMPAFAESKTETPPPLTNKLGMEFVLIPAGKFMMGSPLTEQHRDPDEVMHEVTISRPFYMQTTEVTQGQWKAVMGNNPSGASECGDNCPVERVSWHDCQKFIDKLNKMGEGKYRLPTEAEWEYACRAGTKTSYWWGENIDCSRAMFANNALKGPDTCVPAVKKRNLLLDAPAPVKSYLPNPWGLYDMHGNVWEWVQDWYGKYEAGPVTDPAGPSRGHMKVRRGGSFFKHGWYCRAANRNMGHPYTRYHTLGFRLVRDVE